MNIQYLRTFVLHFYNICRGELDSFYCTISVLYAKDEKPKQFPLKTMLRLDKALTKNTGNIVQQFFTGCVELLITIKQYMTCTTGKVCP